MKELSMTLNAREKRVRKSLKAHGYYLRKSCTKPPTESDQGLYRIVEKTPDEMPTDWVAWGPKWELDIETCEAIIESLDAGDGRADPAQLVDQAAA